MSASSALGKGDGSRNDTAEPDSGEQHGDEPAHAPAAADRPGPRRLVHLPLREFTRRPDALQAGFTSADAGKTAYYALRWVSTRWEKGLWSEPCAATGIPPATRTRRVWGTYHAPTSRILP